MGVRRFNAFEDLGQIERWWNCKGDIRERCRLCGRSMLSLEGGTAAPGCRSWGLSPKEAAARGKMRLEWEKDTKGAGERVAWLGGTFQAKSLPFFESHRPRRSRLWWECSVDGVRRAREGAGRAESREGKPVKGSW